MIKNIIFIFAMVVVVILSGCTNKNESDPVTLKVLYFSQEEFMIKYGNQYVVKNPNVSFSVISLSPYYEKGLSQETYREIVEMEKPDILFGFNLKSFGEEGRLVNLDPFVAHSDDIQINQINKHLIDYLRQQGGGLLYALSPTFIGKALFYNKTIFDKYGIKYPKDGISWGEIFNLAARFPSNEKEDEKTYSFYYAGNNIFNLSKEVADSSLIRFIDPHGKSITINTESWLSIIDPILEGKRRGYISTQSDLASNDNPLHNSPFANGKAAMSIDYSYLLSDLQNADFEWDIVTFPTDASQKGSVSAIHANSVFGISKDSAQIKESWKFLEYINSEEYAKSLQMIGAYNELSAREDSNKRFDNINLHAFYSIPPMDQPSIPVDFDTITELYSVASSELEKAGSLDRSTQEVLSELQEKMQLILQKE